MVPPVAILSESQLHKLDQKAEAIARGADRMRVAWARVGTIGLGLVQRAFNRKSRGQGDWPKVSPVTVILRRKGTGGKIKDEADVARKQTVILRDRADMARSLTVQGGLIGPEHYGVRFGSRMRDIPKKHHEGFTSRFEFDEEKRRRFFQNVQVKVPNPRAASQRISFGKSGKVRRGRLIGKSGRKLKAKVWSKFAWDTWRMLKGMDGRTYKVPQRRIWGFEELTEAAHRRLMMPVRMAVKELLDAR